MIFLSIPSYCNQSNPMARFDDNWEKEFKPSWETTISTNAPAGITGKNPNEARMVSQSLIHLSILKNIQQFLQFSYLCVISWPHLTTVLSHLFTLSATNLYIPLLFMSISYPSQNLNPDSYQLSYFSAQCSNCRGTGKVECYGCNGTGSVQMGSPSGRMTIQCQLCVGKCTAGCGSCRGLGTAYKMKQY